MIKIYDNKDEFLKENIQKLNSFDKKFINKYVDDLYEFSQNSYLLKITNDDEFLLALKSIKNDCFLVIGNVSLIKELINNIVSLGLRFGSYVMKEELSIEFNKIYLNKMKGSFVNIQNDDNNQLLVSMQYNKGSVSSCVLAGGCFWCMAKPYYEYDGIINVYSGYSGGTEILPTYEKVKNQETTHKESVKLIYDESIISYEEILDIYFDTIDPFDDGGQFIDRGNSYTTAIFYRDEIMKERIVQYIKLLEQKYNQKIVVEVLPEKLFYMAEEYHQDYALKNPEAMQKELMESGRIKEER